jgi:CubicO group peptidase (beta-lactamase class C family)
VTLLAACGGGGSGSPSPAAQVPGGGGGSTGFVYRAPRDLDDGWQIADGPGAGRIEALENLMDAIAGGAFPDTDAIAIAQYGELVFDETLRTGLDEFDAEVGNTDPGRHIQFSASKSLAAVMIGIAIDQGFISGVDTPYLQLFPYSAYANWDERKAGITLEDVLTMRLGLEWNEWDPPYDHPDNQLFSFHAAHHDYSKGLLDLPMVHAPGETFAYNTVASTSLGQAIENSTGLSLVDFANSYVIDAMQLREISALDTPTRLPDLGRGLFLYTRDMAKFGQLIMDGGRWNDTRIVSTDWVDAATREHAAIGWLEPEQWDWQMSGYGYQWWLGYFELDGRRLQTFSAEGHGGQLTMVIPELELVIAINASAYSLPSTDPNRNFRLIREFILPAFSE